MSGLLLNISTLCTRKCTPITLARNILPSSGTALSRISSQSALALSPSHGRLKSRHYDVYIESRCNQAEGSFLCVWRARTAHTEQSQGQTRLAEKCRHRAGRGRLGGTEGGGTSYGVRIVIKNMQYSVAHTERIAERSFKIRRTTSSSRSMCKATMKVHP